MGEELTRPAGALVLVTASDTVDIVPPKGYKNPCRALLVGTGGAATILDGSGQERADVPLQTGFNPIQCHRVFASPTASNIWALY